MNREKKEKKQRTHERMNKRNAAWNRLQLNGCERAIDRRTMETNETKKKSVDPKNLD